jgi:hypothetical protein
MAEARMYSGGCHSGRVRYEVTTDPTPVLDCNRSICRKRSALWTYVEPAESKLLSGAEALADDQFNTRNIHHLFCSTCGVGSFSRGQGADGSEGIGINVRCLEGVDPGMLQLTPYDGRSR